MLGVGMQRSWITFFVFLYF